MNSLSPKSYESAKAAREARPQRPRKGFKARSKPLNRQKTQIGRSKALGASKTGRQGDSLSRARLTSQGKPHARLKAGKKTLAWAKVRSALKVRFEAVGIKECEAALDCCWRDNALSFAHRMKRRKITSQSELETVALLCIPCHEAVEHLPADGMFFVITEIIKRREVQP